MQSLNELLSTRPASYTVLIVESPSTDRELYQRYLLADASCRYTLLEADSVALAINLCQSFPVDGILVDGALHATTGLELFQALQTGLKNCQPPLLLPVVIVANQSDLAIVVQAIKLGAEDYLLKQTLTPEQLQLAMRSAIENARLRLQLQRQEERFRVSVENMLDCFGIFSAIRDENGQIRDFRIDYLNAAALDCNQLTSADLGRGLCEVFPAHHTTGLFQDYCRVAETGTPLAKEELIYSDQFGNQYLTRAFDIRASQLNDGIVVAWRDVTARKQAELERQQQLEREHILNQITQQIRRSLDPAEVLNRAVAEVRQFLQADRAFIYRFNPDFSGVIVVESVAAGWESALAAEVEDLYFMETQGEDYRQGRIQVVENIHEAGLTDCHVQMLERFQIQANLVVPILQGDRLWGLLVLNQCAYSRQWQASEVELLQQLAAQIGIAIQQAELYQQVQSSQKRLALSLEVTEQGMWDYDLTSRQSYWSPQCKRRFGLDPDDSTVGDAQFFNYLHPDDRERVAAVTQSVIDTHGHYDVEYRVIWPDGSLHWLHAKARVIQDEQGQPRQMIGTVTDISERKRIEAERQQIAIALAASNERFELAATAVNCLIYDYDLQQNQIWRSQGLSNLFGYSQAEAEPTADWWFNLIHPDHRLGIQAAKQSIALSGESAFRLDYQVLHRDGHYVWVQDHGSIVRNSAGEAIRVVGSTIDITDRKRNEQQLHESEERLQLGVQVAGVAIAHFDYASDQVTLSPEAALLYGYGPDQSVITREQIHDTFHPEERQELMEIIRQVLDPHGPGWFAREHRVVWPSGEVRWLNVRKQVFFSQEEQPRPDYAILAAVDITDRKQTEAALRLSEERYRYLAGLIPQLVWIADASGRIVDVNDRWSDYTGLSLEQAQQQSWETIVYPEDVAILAQSWRKAQQEGSHYQAEGRMRRADGLYRWHLHQAMPLKDEQGQTVRWFGTATDIHELKLIEADRARLLAEAEAARAEAEAANRSKDDFVSLVAHELRSPLNAIMGWAKLLQTRQLDAATTHKALETIARNTQAQVQLVEDLLDVSRMVRGSLRLSMASTNLAAVIEAATETVRPLAEARDLRLETRIQTLMPISGDSQRLQQVVLNLLTNAIKFTPKAGQVQILLDQQGSQARIQVSDTGKGISPDLMPRIFERFQQDQQNTTAKQGLGLGLAIVKYIVEQHGGSIMAQSQGEGRGATFTVLLPFLQSEQRQSETQSDENQAELAPDPAQPLFQAEPPAGSAPASLAGLRVLLVDDDLDMLNLTALVLEQAGATVQTATGARLALERLTQFQPDLLISDIAMPEQNGYELLQQVQRLYSSSIPAIALTAYAGEEYRQKSLRVGFSCHLAKPIEPEELVRLVLAVIQRRSI
jgi:PAS domain S-box-containing protein